MGFRKYVTKREHCVYDELPQTCIAAKHDGTAATVLYAPNSTKPVTTVIGEWSAWYQEEGVACSYTDAEFNELYELVPDNKREWLGG